MKTLFPRQGDEKSFEDGRVHSFRHYFFSACANSGVPERIVMEWLGHQDSEMVHIYYHLHDEARRRMAALDFIWGAGGRSTDKAGQVLASERGCRARFAAESASAGTND